MARPVIAVTGPERGAFGPRFLVALAVRFYGGKPIQLRPCQKDRRSYHAVVVTGGHDIDPVLYAAEPEVEPRYDPARDALETQVINEALTRHLPLLGICRGAQLLNVCLGGTLFQDLRQHRRRTSHRRTLLPLKTLVLAKGSRLAEQMGSRNRRINSLHNQAIDQVGDGLRVAGRDLDGIIQAVEGSESAYLLGVQWHPEFLLFMPTQRRLFRRLVKQARQQTRTGVRS